MVYTGHGDTTKIGDQVANCDECVKRGRMGQERQLTRHRGATLPGMPTTWRDGAPSSSAPLGSLWITC
nr:hypothetical protein ICEMyc226_00336 [Mycolicibacterium sp.]